MRSESFTGAMVIPVLYSFRRCPYAMRARLALDASGQRCELREVVLKNKPAEMLAVSPKATVPVLVDTDGTVIDESLDIMLWSLRRNDPEGWLTPDVESLNAMLELIRRCDREFKSHLDRYKYPQRFAGADALQSREEGETFLRLLDERIATQRYLSGSRFALTDGAIAPFVRQFANVDLDWFATQPWRGLHEWLQAIVNSERFQRIMRPVQPWVVGSPGVLYPFDPASL